MLHQRLDRRMDAWPHRRPPCPRTVILDRRSLEKGQVPSGNGHGMTPLSRGCFGDSGQCRQCRSACLGSERSSYPRVLSGRVSHYNNYHQNTLISPTEFTRRAIRWSRFALFWTMTTSSRTWKEAWPCLGLGELIPLQVWEPTLEKAGIRARKLGVPGAFAASLRPGYSLSRRSYVR